MSSSTGSLTSVSLLERLREEPRDAEAWEAFVRRYRPLIYAWCREWGLQRADAEDVAQDVFTKLTQKMGGFQYDPSRCFRAWLKTITQRVWSDRIATWYRRRDVRVLQAIEALEARAEERRDQSPFDRELLELAMRRVRRRVAAVTWEAFRLTALEGLTGLEASNRLSVPVASVFVAKHRVQKMLREEIRKREARDESLRPKKIRNDV
ncbi:MAG: sigma-70 family RNA polymerase sigma factor [Isosphaeraceae bacterium]|nr:sigma-70 family RNA polymerase sigma factor [Isosphaeraceae bacterium]